MGEDENNPREQAAEQAQPKESVGTAETSAEKTEEKGASAGDRKNAAKAFYRALYSGEDVAPDDFGIGTKTADKQSTGPCPNCARFEAESKESEKKATDNENFYKRIAADFENYRRRNDREREEAVGIGIQKAIESILPALDDLDRARSSLTAVVDTKAVVNSLNLVFARFEKCLEPLGVKAMDVLGEHFDPKFHEPVQEIATTEYADGAVAQELRRGYLIKEKVIRPALVNVASNESGVITPKKESTEISASASAAPDTAQGTTQNTTQGSDPSTTAQFSPGPASETLPETPSNNPNDKTVSSSSVESSTAGSATLSEESNTQSPDKPESKREKATEEGSAEPAKQSADNSNLVSNDASLVSSDSSSSPVDPSGENAPSPETSIGTSDSKEMDKTTADQAANKQRAANALERLRKNNPKATAELPAYQPDESERVTEAAPLPIDPTATADFEVFRLGEEEEITGSTNQTD